MSTATLGTSTDALRHALATGAPLTVLDVRPAPDRADWWIPGSTHLDAYEALRRGRPAALPMRPQNDRPHRLRPARPGAEENECCEEGRG